MTHERLDREGSPVSLASVQIDVTTRLGAPSPVTTTGFPSLDNFLGGGLRPGVLVTVVSAPGLGRSTFALFMAYMAARSRASTLFTAVGLDDTEIVARLAARALHRERPEIAAAYGAIWSGRALTQPEVRAPLLGAIETVVRKVGSSLHLKRAGSLEATGVLAESASELWTRSERVVVVVDDLEAYYASSDGNPAKQASVNASLAGRVMQVAFDLKSVAEQGCAVVATALSCHAELVMPASSLTLELRASSREATGLPSELSLGARELDLVVLKNRLGEAGSIPIRMVPGAGFVEERR
ncbi:MAG TPA: DnaB-like helicase C-terminal domain-containing protein [Polyangiaceae bacterium]|nr:DnaB-like helicase C-terminal domain-containing protein [Polyangiaceae bacterium]